MSAKAESGKRKAGEVRIHCGDALKFLRKQPEKSIDLFLTSPPYEDARTYGIDFKARGQSWVDWYLPYCLEMNRVCRGLTAIVVEGKTKDFRYSATPFLLMADLHRAGVKLRKPPIYNRVGIPGSGGPDWLRNDWEPIVCFSPGRLPWSDNTAMGRPTKYDEGGPCSNRRINGTRVGYVTPEDVEQKGKHRAERQAGRKYAKPKNGKANPGNVIHCKVGGGHMGSKLAHENEAPFPEALAEFLIRSFCPPGGTVCDPMAGSGTVGAVAVKLGRNALLCDKRESQCDLMRRRIEEAKQQAA